jgi:predicted MPP superfamily phosphohydrolase
MTRVSRITRGKNNFFPLESPAAFPAVLEGKRMISPSEAAGHTNYRRLAERMGRDVLERRILKQAALWARETHQGRGIFRLQSLVPFDDLVNLGLRVSGLAGPAHRQFLNVRVVQNEVRLRGLPDAFEGFRLLHLSDLHCDLDPQLIDVVIARLVGVNCDAVVITGDYHNTIGAKHDRSLELMGRLIPHLPHPRFGVLGNHDFIEKVAYLEAAGLPILLNESAFIERAGQRLWICGVDDPHFFQTHDLVRARAAVPDGQPAILLSHSPETWREAASLGYSLMLSGHTHGGQLCLPGGTAIVKNAPIPRRLLAGPWREGALVGYTSRGTGGCGVAARLFCPPEITVHVLHCSTG